MSKTAIGARTNIILLCMLCVGCEQSGIEFQQLSLPPQPVSPDIGAFVYLRGGLFEMGAPDDGLKRFPGLREVDIESASPRHMEYVGDFEIGKYEVTAVEYCDFLNDCVQAGEKVRARYVWDDYTATIMKNPDGKFVAHPGFEYAPALHVFFDGAKAYCEWLSRKTGVYTRLPTEIEWEYAARGPSGRTYPWGEESPIGRAFLRAHYRYLEDGRFPGVVTVGTFPNGATPEGVHDLIGNAPEWCGNCFYEYSAESIGSDPAKFASFANPTDDCVGNTLPYPFDIPSVPIRSGQYISTRRGAPGISTGWTREDYPRHPAKGTERFRGYGFRVLREVPHRTQ